MQMHAAIQRAREMLQQLDDDERNGTGCFAERDSLIVESAAQNEQRWRELQPKPAPTPPPPPPQQITDANVRREIDAAAGALADILGEEVAASERALRERLENEIGQLRAEIAVLQGQLRRIGDMQAQALDLPMMPLRGGGSQYDH
jgi:hypothetical protein